MNEGGDNFLSQIEIIESYSIGFLRQLVGVRDFVVALQVLGEVVITTKCFRTLVLVAVITWVFRGVLRFPRDVSCKSIQPGEPAPAGAAIGTMRSILGMLAELMVVHELPEAFNASGRQ